MVDVGPETISCKDCWSIFRVAPQLYSDACEECGYPFADHGRENAVCHKCYRNNPNIVPRHALMISPAGGCHQRLCVSCFEATSRPIQTSSIATPAEAQPQPMMQRPVIVGERYAGLGPEIESVFGLLTRLLRRGGENLRESDRELLSRPIDSLHEVDNRRLGELYGAMRRGFFFCAADGYAFQQIESIEARFGCSLEDNYPNASSAFLRFATTYWTYKIALEAIRSELFPEHHEKGIAQLPFRLEEEIASVFFPMAPGHGLLLGEREELQRRIIQNSGAPIDVEDFIRGNPLLQIIEEPMMSEERYQVGGFLFNYGGYVVYAAFIVGLILNTAAALSYFSARNPILGLWALAAIFALPKSVLGLILLLGRKSLVFLNMPSIIRNLFPGTMRKYRSDSLNRIFSGINPVAQGFMYQLLWLVLALLPLAALAL